MLTPVLDGAALYPRAVRYGEPPLVVIDPYTEPSTVGVAAEAPTFTKSEPFHAAKHFSPAMIVMPVVGPTPTSLIDCVLDVALITT
jgi:hypothetical protein